MFELELPEKFYCLFEPAPLKVFYGGRGGAKTESFARALIVLSTQKKLRILCLREFQKSLDESVKQTIELAIADLGLSEEFEIQDKVIISKRTGSEFLFYGLRYNIDSIKSIARIDIAWIEEARNVSANSIDKLMPTIRGRHENDPSGMGGPHGLGPEIWISFNPELDDDVVYDRFVVHKEQWAPDYLEGKRYAYVIKVNYTDNPWFPPDLRRQMILSKGASMDNYLHVWEGNTKQVLDGAIYAEEIRKVLKENRRGKVPYDPSRAVHTFWDLGHDDYCSIWFVQQVGVEYNLINFFQDRLKKIPYYIEHLQSLKYNYGKHYLPHDGDNETIAARSPAKQMRDIYPKSIIVVPRVPQKVVGIRAARSVFDLCNFDEENTSEGWQCLTRYQYAVNEDTGAFSKNPLHNEFSHGADAFQTFALSLKSETATKKHPEHQKTAKVIRLSPNRGHIGTGWMG